MSPADFMNEVVLPTVRDFGDQRQSRRHAYVACIVTFHLKDYLKKAGEVGIEDKMRSCTGDAFDVVRGVCNGTKHVTTGDNHVIAFQAGTDYERPPAFADVMICDLSYIDDEIGGREIGGTSGVGIDLYGAVRTTLTGYISSFPAQLESCDLSIL